MNATKLLITLIATVSIASAHAGGILPAPHAVEASDAAYHGAIVVTWTSVEGADSYRIYRNTNTDWTTADEIGVTSDTAFIDPITSRKRGQSYHYWVFAEAGNTVSTLSEAAVGSPRISPGGPRPDPRLQRNFRQLRSKFVR